MVAIVLLSMAIVFGLVAVGISSVELSQLFTLLAGLFGLWSIYLTLWKKQKILVLLQWILFLPIAIFGFMGSW